MQFFVKQMRMRNRVEIISDSCHLIGEYIYRNDRIKTE